MSTTACLILAIAGGTLLPISTQFPDVISCEMGGASMVDGKTVRGYICVPASIYRCGTAPPPVVPKDHQSRLE